MPKVWRNESSSASDPESKAPLSEVTVCDETSLFVQQTVVPGATVTDGGT